MLDSQKIKQLILADTTPQFAASKPPALVKKIQDELTELHSTKQELDALQKSLDSMIDMMSKNHSVLTQAASYWSELPLWQKIIAGILLSAPCFVIGIMANIAVLITISIFALITYIASALLLDNHHNHSQKATGDLKKMVKSMAGVLMKIIEKLGALNAQIKEQINDFAQENETLAHNLSVLSEQVTHLNELTEQLKEDVLALHATKEELELTAITLTHSVKEHSEILQTNQMQIERVQNDLKLSQTQLSEKISELHHVKVEMTISNDQLKAMVGVLNGTIETLSETVIGDEEQRASFQERLKQFLSDKEASFDLVAKRICEAERKLSEVVEQLNNNNLKYDELLNRHEQQVVRLEGFGSAESAQSPQISDATALNNIGFYASTKQERHLLEQQVTPSRPIIEVH